MNDSYSSGDTIVFADAGAFMKQLSIDIQQAQQTIWIQCMSFEADSIGNKLINLLISKPEVERVLLIDSYSKYVVNDTFLFGPKGVLNTRNARTERLQLEPLVRRAREAGIEVRFTNPVGPLFTRYFRRNHKKMVLIDDQISYLGGLNFTEHNFEWADMMVRHTDRELARILQDSFRSDRHGESAEPVRELTNGDTVYTLNGRATADSYRRILQRVRSAHRVTAVSPYISYPMLDAIAEVDENRVLLPGNNNKSFVRLIHGLKRYKNINYHYLGNVMVHMKFLLIDDNIVVYGSSNFDTISYFFEKEILLQRVDAQLATLFRQLVSGLINQCRL